MLLEVAAKEETEVLNEVLLVVLAVFVRLANVGGDGQHLLELLHGEHEELDELLVVLLRSNTTCSQQYNNHATILRTKLLRIIKLRNY